MKKDRNRSRQPRTLPASELNALGEIHVERVVPGGRGFARAADGKPIFVRGALPGDRVTLASAFDRGSYFEASASRLIEPSAERTTPRCGYLERCGGCDWMALDAVAQRSWKRHLVEEAMVRTGGFSAATLPLEREVRFVDTSDGYRVRARLQVRGGRVGFFSEGSHDLVEVVDCSVLVPELRRWVEKVRGVVARAPSEFTDVEFVEVRTLPDAGGERSSKEKNSVFVSVRASGRAPKRSVFDEFEREACVRFSGDAELSEQPYFVTDDTFALVPVGGFCQVNAGVNRGIVRRVLEEAREVEAETFLDLYSGSGNFSLPLARAGLRGHAVEIAAEAARAGTQGAERQGLEHVSFHAADVAEHAKELARRGEKFDVVLLDPPRAGALPALEASLELARKRLVIVSCDPVTLARDLRVLVGRGARLDSLEAWDMFPETHHVETVACLDVRC